MEVCYSMQWRFGYYFFSDSFGYRTIFDECAFSNHFQCRDSHVVTWMHMTSRLNTTRGSQLVAKQWRRCALGDLGPGGHTTILARGHTSHFPWGSRSTNKPFGAVRDSCGPATSFILVAEPSCSPLLGFYTVF